MKTREVLQRLNLSKHELFKFIEDFRLKIKKNANNELDFSEEDLSLISNIIKLKEEDHGVNTIKNMLGNVHELNVLTQNDNSYYDDVKDTLFKKIPDNYVYEPEINVFSKINSDIENNILDLNYKVDKIYQMVEKSLELSYENARLKTQIESQNEKIKMIKDSFQKDIENLNKEIEKKSLECKQLNDRIRDLEEELNKEKNKSGITKLLGK
jgi:N-terminal acetyltransferase B complex non-catalytic subunit